MQERKSESEREKVREIVKKRNPKRSLKYIQQFGIKILFLCVKKYPPPPLKCTFESKHNFAIASKGFPHDGEPQITTHHKNDHNNINPVLPGK